MTTALETGAPGRASARPWRNCSTISGAERFRTTPARPLAQNRQPTGQPTWVETQRVAPARPGITTVSTALPSRSRRRRRKVPSGAACRSARLEARGTRRSASREGRSLGRSVISPKDRAPRRRIQARIDRAWKGFPPARTTISSSAAGARSRTEGGPAARGIGGTLAEGEAEGRDGSARGGDVPSQRGGDLPRDALGLLEARGVRSPDARVASAAEALAEGPDVRPHGGGVPGVLPRGHVEARAGRDDPHGVDRLGVVVEGGEALPPDPVGGGVVEDDARLRREDGLGELRERAVAVAAGPRVHPLDGGIPRRLRQVAVDEALDEHVGPVGVGRDGEGAHEPVGGDVAEEGVLDGRVARGVDPVRPAPDLVEPLGRGGPPALPGLAEDDGGAGERARVEPPAVALLVGGPQLLVEEGRRVVVEPVGGGGVEVEVDDRELLPLAEGAPVAAPVVVDPLPAQVPAPEALAQAPGEERRGADPVEVAVVVDRERQGASPSPLRRLLRDLPAREEGEGRLLGDDLRGDDEARSPPLRGELVEDVEEHVLEDRAQRAAPRLPLHRQVRDRLEPLPRELDLRPLHPEEGLVLADERVLRLDEDADQLVAPERVEDRHDGEAPDELRDHPVLDQVPRLELVEEGAPVLRV